MKEDVVASLVCILEAQETRDVPLSWGQALHGLILRLAREKNRSLSKEWHDSQDIKPFSLSPLFGKFAKTPTGYKVVRNHTYWFKLGVLGAEGFNSLGDALFPLVAKNGELLISNITFKIIDAMLADHPWAALSSWQELNKVNPNGNPIIIRFFSPTTFRRKKANRIIPDPELVFGSLLNKWNKFGSRKIENEFKDRFLEIIISRYSLTTSTYNLNTQPMIGFKGRCGYEIFDDKVLSTAAKLANLAIFSGIGQKTTMGMGVARVE